MCKCFVHLWALEGVGWRVSFSLNRARLASRFLLSSSIQNISQTSEDVLTWLYFCTETKSQNRRVDQWCLRFQCGLWLICANSSLSRHRHFLFNREGSVITRPSAFICGLRATWTLWHTSTLSHSLTHPTPGWARWTHYTSIKAMPPFIIRPSYLLLPSPPALALIFCPLFALPLHLLLFAAIKARVKFEPPGWHC